MRCIVGGKVRVRQGVCVTGGSKLRGLAVSVPDTTANPMTMLEVFDPTGTGFELVFRNPEGFGDIPCFVADQGVRKRNVLRDRRGGQPINELAFNLWEFGRSELEKISIG